MKIDIDKLKEALLPVADQVREKLSSPLGAVAEAHFVGMQIVLSRVFIWITETKQGEGDIDMNRLTKSLSVEIVKISDIPHTKKDSKWQPLVKEEVDSLKAGQAKLIDPAVIKYGHLNSILTKLKKDREIGDDVKLIKRGEKYFLAKVEA